MDTPEATVALRAVAVAAVVNTMLQEAKDLVDGAPKTVKEGATKEEADKIKKQLEAVGAKIELK